MEHELKQAFFEEASSALMTVRSSILAASQEGTAGGQLESALRLIQSICDASRLTEFEAFAVFAESLESGFKSIVESGTKPSDEDSRRLLDEVAELEALLAQAQFESGVFPANIASFVDESFDHLTIPAESEAEPEAAEASDSEGFEGFEIDEDMLEIFALEAEDLLRNISGQIEILASKPDDREALLEIRRNAHTLKGSAGIIGFKALSDLAHRVEDLLDFIAENQISGDEKLFELLLASTDCLSALAAGDRSSQLTKKISRLHQSFDELPGFLRVRPAKAASAGASESKPAPEAVTPSGNQEQAETPKSQGNGPVVRVSLNKLDDLVNLVSDLVISRSVFERRLNEFQRQIEELHHSNDRLKRATSKLETDFEAGMLESPSLYGRATGFPSALPAGFGRNPVSEFDTLELDRYTEFHQTTRELIETTGDTSAINMEFDSLRENFELLFENQRRLIDDLQQRLLRLRMVKFGSLAARLQRTVRITCEQESKLADLTIEGEEVEVDTQILDSLVEPLLHLLRNAVAHGIESPDTRRLLGKDERGSIGLNLQSEGTHVVLTIADDGRGISASSLKEKAVANGHISAEEAAAMNEEQAFSLGFLPGLTTADSVSQTSGRGVGMNIVKNSITRRQGTISIESVPQRGTVFTIRVPMALAVARGLIVKANSQLFAFPLTLIKQVREIRAEELAASGELLTVDDRQYRVRFLNNLLGMPASGPDQESIPVLLLQAGDEPCALIVEGILKPEEMVIKPLGAPLRKMPELLGATILADGSVVPVLDLVYLLKDRQLVSTSRKLNRVAKKKTQRSVLIVDDSPSVRHVTSNLVRNAGMNALAAKDGLEALEMLQGMKNLPGAILTDVEMPRMDGYELLASLKRDHRLSEIPVIMITSRAGEKHRKKAIDLGVSEYVTKPFDDATLVLTIRALMDGN